jgi:peptide-methionine (R)-S-oxide reductase
MRMNRRRFIASLSATPLVATPFVATQLACAQEGPWPGPTTPRSYVTHPNPPVGERLVLTDDVWRSRLTRAQYDILRRERTEPSFSCELWSEHRTGTFYCGGCGAPLFSSREKFESGTGWASFFRPIETGRVSEHRDASHGMERVEVRCARCDGHLGHVFPDGPQPTGLRYCINGSILEFVPA